MDELKRRFGSGQLSLRTGLTARVDFSRSTVAAGGKDFSIGSVGAAAQELIITGGLEAWVKGRIDD